MSSAIFWFVRHGQTEFNRLGLRCGGDIDVPLNAYGELQCNAAIKDLAGKGIELIVASPLVRTMRTAAIIGNGIGHPPLLTYPALQERLLGGWNGKPVAETEPLLKARVTPPGGESEDDFHQRVSGALLELTPLILERRTLIVSSKGVARMIDKLTGRAGRSAENATVLEYFLP